MSSDASRDELVAAVLRVIRKGASQTALFSQAVAERLGLAGTDGVMSNLNAVSAMTVPSVLAPAHLLRYDVAAQRRE
jgi:hypothetical protein